MTDTKSDKSSPQLVPWSARVRHSYLRLAERFAAGADENPALEGIRLEPHSRGGVVVIGANRHGMGLFYDAAAEITAAATVRLTAACLELAGGPSGDKDVTLRPPAQDGATEPGWAVDFVDDHLHPYPNWRGALPVGPFRGLATAMVDASSVGPIGLLRGTLQLWFCEDEGVILMRSHRYPEFVGVVNTVLDAVRLPAVPDWLQAID